MKCIPMRCTPIRYAPMRWRAEVRNGEESEKPKQKEIERQRRLCIVRNAGESVGRLVRDMGVVYVSRAMTELFVDKDIRFGGSQSDSST
jgi:hypothetical protein